MAEKKSELHLNGTNEIATRHKNYAAPVRLWRKLQINEWTFIFLLFIMSLTIFLGKLYINYGNILQLQSNSKSIVPSASIFSNIYNIFDLSDTPSISKFNVNQLTAMSEKFVNISQYDDVVNVTMLLFKTYGWLIKAATSGLIVMSFTWFIIYKDSSIPGINPPFPFSLSKQRFARASGLQINYLVGILNGILIFIYMCL
ncbi:PREDICTED: uncharacterized protein LOC107194945 [Dufourea novaeangliae]|uniref:ADP-ribosylation factor-like protein 6-interacting protein 6 n=1 Tax=Dufourea novaeangliae TaxID=178035 RepID=A0A154P3D9_DUFNO|nr:PREDICTED: uncharacterized protein LOC107194945 [Dufourea novaeangliae]KZC06436.1 ADP-ribosylation factor-like protein 6-interacting protein 6 [Dufourea novaeangliae]